MRKVYCGQYQSAGPCRVVVRFVNEAGATVSERNLSPRTDFFNHSPDGYQWSYGGSGPSQLALAILADHLDDKVAAVRLHQAFKSDRISKLPKADFEMTSDEVAAWLLANREVAGNA